MKRGFAVVALLAVVGVPGCGASPAPVSTPAGTPPPPTPQVLDERVDVDFGSATLRAEVADEPREWAVGLMHRTSLAPDSGMLFVFDSPRTSGFWMRNTRIPLSIAFLRSEGPDTYVVVDVLEMVPCPDETPDAQCPRYAPSGAYDAALEANADWFTTAGVVSGDTAQTVR